MNVKNKGCIRRISFNQLKAAKTRNIIAIFAIALTTVLFTSLFTLALSINSSFEEYQFRQLGGYNHGAFKEVDEVKKQALAAHKKVKEYGMRTTCGFISEPPFAKLTAEISWMDDNCSKWCYIDLKEGHLPKEKNEIIMDTLALEKLGIPAQLGQEVELTYMLGDIDRGIECTDTFVLVGFWEYDSLSPVHYINISQDYLEEVEAEWLAAGGEPFRSDMNVMLASSVDIRGVMESIDTDLGYQWEYRELDNCVRIGVNWGYTTSELASSIDFSLVFAIVAFLLLVVFTGYLIIYNIFRISVSNDIRFYGLLKTIGTTPRQLKRIIRYQALTLSIVGIPIGFLLGYFIGSVLTPIVMATTTMGEVVKVSSSPAIFLFSGVFALFTVLISCRRPGRLAAKISPVEAVRYTEADSGKKKSRAAKGGASIAKMASANVGRSKGRTALVLISLSLAVVLLNSVYVFVIGFDMEKYVSHNLKADFIVGTTDYFRYNAHYSRSGLPEETVGTIVDNVNSSFVGSGYSRDGAANMIKCYVTEQQWKGMQYLSEEMAAEALQYQTRRGELVETNLLLEGLDEALFDKITVVEGDIAPLFDKDSYNIALAVRLDDDGNVIGNYPKIDDKLPVRYLDDLYVYDSRTGEPSDETTPDEYRALGSDNSHDVEYNICAYVSVPYCMGFRYGVNGVEAVLPKDIMERDSGLELFRLFYLFDTPDDVAEAAAEEFLAALCAGENSAINYESKKVLREDLEGFKNMFGIVGGVLSFVVGIVGILNFFNAILTGILSRRREFAMLQSVGMTGKQLKKMLVCEGMVYALGAIVISLAVSFIMEPLAGRIAEGMFWWFSFKFALTPMVFVIPVFVLLGVTLPLAVYHFAAKKSIVERLRESE
ncbi:MAG: ABC transporter permease [Clostridiales bacterium]|nr:ABC transporter permease [Clostridiales bacterium]